MSLPETLPQAERERLEPAFQQAMRRLFGYDLWMAKHYDFIHTNGHYDCWLWYGHDGYAFKTKYVCNHCGRELAGAAWMRKHLAKEHGVTCQVH